MSSEEKEEDDLANSNASNEDLEKKDKDIIDVPESFPTNEHVKRIDEDSSELCVSGNEGLKIKDSIDISGSNKDIIDVPGSDKDLKKKAENIRPVLKKNPSSSSRRVLAPEKKVKPETKSEILKQDTIKKRKDVRQPIEPR